MNNKENKYLNEVYPNKGESKKDFIARFMKVTKDEYPDVKQRYAVANSYWDRRNKVNEEEHKMISEFLEELNKIDESVKEGISGTMTPEEIAKKHSVSIEEINKQLEKGIEVEKEHTEDEKEAERIALDHLFEIPDYYDRLDKMEKGALKEDTVKTKSGKWTNKGKEGTHGTFKTKKEADQQRKAMFTNKKKGAKWGESLKEEYGPYKGSYILDEIARDVELGNTVGSVHTIDEKDNEKEIGWTLYLTINGEEIEDLNLSHVTEDYFLEYCSYPIKDGFDNYYDVEATFNKDSGIPEEDLRTMGFSRNDIIKYGQGEDVTTYFTFRIEFDDEDFELDESINESIENADGAHSYVITDEEDNILEDFIDEQQAIEFAENNKEAKFVEKVYVEDEDYDWDSAEVVWERDEDLDEELHVGVDDMMSGKPYEAVSKSTGEVFHIKPIWKGEKLAVLVSESDEKIKVPLYDLYDLYDVYDWEGNKLGDLLGDEMDEDLDEDFTKKEGKEIIDWWKEVEIWNGENDHPYDITNDYSDIEGMHAAMFDMLNDLKDKNPELYKKGRKIYNKNAMSKISEGKLNETGEWEEDEEAESWKKLLADLIFKYTGRRVSTKRIKGFDKYQGPYFFDGRFEYWTDGEDETGESLIIIDTTDGNSYTISSKDEFKEIKKGNAKPVTESKKLNEDDEQYPIEELDRLCKEYLNTISYLDRLDDGTFEYKIYPDYRDGIEPKQAYDMLKKGMTVDSFYDNVDDWYYYYDDSYSEIRRGFEDYLNDKGFDIDADDLSDEIWEVIQDNVSIYADYDFYLNQEFKSHIIVDTGDANYDFSLNPNDSIYAGDNHNLDDEDTLNYSSLVWLVKQQGHTVEELRDALENGTDNKFLKSVCDEIYNATSSLNCLVFLCEATLRQMLEFTPECTITINKCYSCGLFDAVNGGGSILEIELEKPVVIPGKYVGEFTIDEGSRYGYGVDDVYGLTNSAYKADVEISCNGKKEESLKEDTAFIADEDQFKEINRICKKIGIEKVADINHFKKEMGCENCSTEKLIELLREYEKELGDDFKIEESLDEIKISELTADTYSVKDDSVRGFETKSREQVKVGDEVIIDNHFTKVVADDKVEECNKTINIRESLNAIDNSNYNQYDLRNLYDSQILSEDRKVELAKLLHENKDAKEIYKFLAEGLNEEEEEETVEETEEKVEEERGNAFFIRKPISLEDIKRVKEERIAIDPDSIGDDYSVIKVVESENIQSLGALNSIAEKYATLFDEMGDNYYDHYAIKVRTPEGDWLIDTNGYDYARYVAFVEKK